MKTDDDLRSAYVKMLEKREALSRRSGLIISSKAQRIEDTIKQILYRRRLRTQIDAVIHDTALFKAKLKELSIGDIRVANNILANEGVQIAYKRSNGLYKYFWKEYEMPIIDALYKQLFPEGAI